MGRGAGWSPGRRRHVGHHESRAARSVAGNLGRLSATSTGGRRMSDLIVRGGTVVDGTGGPSRAADVRVRAGVIVEVAPDLAPDRQHDDDAGGRGRAPGRL